MARARASPIDARPDPGGWAQSGPYDSTRVARHQRVAGDPSDEEDLRGVPSQPQGPNTTRSRSLVSRRAIVDIVRAATLGSYGVIGFAGGGLIGRLGERLGLAPRGIAVRLHDGITVDLDLVVAHGVPIAEVARQVDSAVRYGIRRALGRDLDRLTIHVDGLRVAALDVVRSADRRGGGEATPDELAASGTDVA
jgi:uncharacterized alkaline shock family protein YloU